MVDAVHDPYAEPYRCTIPILYSGMIDAALSTDG